MKTLYDKVWESHLVREEPGKPALIYVDLHLIHEVTSPQAFEGLRIAGRRVRRPERTFATLDHAIPTINRNLPFNDPIAAQQVETLRTNCAEFGIPLYDLDRIEQGIIHVFGPEQGLTQPGMTRIRRRTERSVHWHLGSLRARSSMFSPPRRCSRHGQRISRSVSKANCRTASRPRT